MGGQALRGHLEGMLPAHSRRQGVVRRHGRARSRARRPAGAWLSGRPHRKLTGRAARSPWPTCGTGEAGGPCAVEPGPVLPAVTRGYARLGPDPALGTGRAGGLDARGTTVVEREVLRSGNATSGTAPAHATQCMDPPAPSRAPPAAPLP